MTKKRKTELDIESTSAVPAEAAPAAPASRQEETPPEPSQAPKRPKKPRAPRKPLSPKAKRNIVVGLAVAIMLGGAVMVANMAGREKKKLKIQSKREKAVNVPKPPEVKVETLSNVVLDPFIFTVKEDKGDRFIRITLALQMSNENVVAELQENMSLIRNAVLFYMETRDKRDLLVDARRKDILNNIQYNIDRSLQEGRVEKVLVNELSVY